MQKILFILQSYWKNILLIVFSILLIAMVSCYFIFKNNEPLETNTILNEEAIAKVDTNDLVEEVKDEDPKTFYVDVKGAVNNAGVYEVNENMIIMDVITLAGGFTKNAYQNGINLSKKLTAEMVIYVYTKSEIAEAKSQTEVKAETSTVDNLKVEEEVENICTTPTYNICECVEETNSVIVPSTTITSTSDNSNTNTNTTTNTVTNNNTDSDTDNPTNTSDTTQSLVNINTATITELTTLSGIGESKAKAIITYREENGNFSNIEDIKNVSGIGDALFEKIKDYITV